MENEFTKEIPNFFVHLSKNGKGYNRYIHRLVYETFIGEIRKGYTIDHIDENKTNNKLENLQQLSRKNNLKKYRKIIIDRTIEGYKQIEEFPNYYINKEGKILSFKFGKSDFYEGRFIQRSKHGMVSLRKDNKHCAVSIKALLHKYFDIGIIIPNRKYKNIIYTKSRLEYFKKMKKILKKKLTFFNI